MAELENLYNQFKYDRTISTKSKAWFRDEIKNFSNVTSDLALREGGKQVSTIQPGSMYMYYYSPKHKDTLPYYDVFPMTIPFNADKTSFTGLNLHYLPPQIRIKLLDKLMQFATNKNLTDNTKLQYSWELVRNASNQKWAEACIKRYLTGYVKSRFVKIQPTNWFTAAMLPVARFKKASEQKVWKDSLS